MNSLQFAVSLIQQDTIQAIARPIRSNEMSLFPVFIGQPNYFEFTRDGYLNPNSIEKRSHLKRIALVCDNGALLHRTWNSLDPKDRNTYEDKHLIDNLSDCHFGYLNQSLQLLSEWREHAVTQSQHQELFPKAIQINLTLRDRGEINLLFIIPEALYAASEPH